MATSLSDFLKVDKESLDTQGCFDTIIDLDSLMFVNFLRVRDSSIPEISGAYDHISTIFSKIGVLLDASQNENDRFWKKAYKILEMSEFEEICMGYSKGSTSGSGSGKQLKKIILNTGKDIIAAGVKDPQIFELVGLFEDNIGPDRISDFIARAISKYLKAYTLRVLGSLNINAQSKPDIKFKDGLIINPFNNKALYFLPKDLLHELPIAHEWEDISLVCSINEEVRNEINEKIGETWKDMTITAKKEAARRVVLGNPDLIRELIKDYKKFNLAAYDFEKDPLGESTWYQVAKEISSKKPLDIEKKKIESIEDLHNIVLAICNKYKELIENNGLNEVLYFEGKPRKERIAQRLFYGIADAYCESNGLDISPETNSGRGAVDFKFSIGYQIRAIVEIKLTTNNKLVHGYEKQIKEYRKAENSAFSVYFVIDNGGSESKITSLVALYNDNIASGSNNCELILVDGKIKPSASKY